MRYLGNSSKIGVDLDTVLQAQCLRYGKYTALAFEELLEDKGDKLLERVHKHIPQEHHIAINFLLCDLYHSIYLVDVEFVNASLQKKDYRMNRILLKKLMELPDHSELRALSIGDELISFISMEVLAGSIVDIFKEYLKSKEELQKLIDEAKENQEDIEAPDGKVINRAINEYYKGLQDNAIKSNGTTSSLPSSCREAKDRADLMSKFSLASSGGSGNDGLSFEDSIHLSEVMKGNFMLRKIINMAGELIEILRANSRMKKKTRSTDRSDIKGIKLSSDYSSAVSSDLAQFGIKATEDLFMKKVSSSELITKEYDIKSTLGKGPIIALVDTSGSMCGEPEIFARAACIVLYQITREQRRDLKVIFFSSGTRPENLTVLEFPSKEPIKVDTLKQLASYSDSGGTDFQSPLTRAKTEIDTYKKFSKADIVMITDGAAEVQEQFKKKFKLWKEQRSVNLLALAIDVRWDADYGVLKHIADAGVNLTQLRDIETSFDEASSMLLNM